MHARMHASHVLQVLQALRSTFSTGLQLPPYQTAAQAEAEALQRWEDSRAAAAAAKREAEEREAARQELLRKHTPYQVRPGCPTG